MKKLILILLLLNSFIIVAQDDELDEDLLELSLEELLNVTVDVAKTNLSMRETPAIISVITKEEIYNSGARDLVDVLKMVPGFHFGIDVTNVAGVGVRGNWGHEGKVLMLIDGMEMNENLFSTLQFGQHYNIKNIEKIEIIRGPGSSIYGGFAELGVINIVTKTGAEIEGAQFSAQYGVGGNGTIRNTYNLNLGKSFTNGSFALSTNYGWAQRSFDTYEDVDGLSTELEDGARLRPASINGKLIVGNFKANFMYDDYVVESADQYGWVEGKDNMSFRNTYTHLEYGFDVNENVTVTPSLNYKFGTPWATDVSGAFGWDVENDVYALYSIKSSRLSPSLTVNATIGPKVSVLVGADSYFDKAENMDGSADYFGNGNEVNFSNMGLFLQGVGKFDIANFTLGARFDKHSEVDAAFSPRIGVTKKIENFNFKLLYSKAFRAPGVENINFNNSIKPEFTDVLELELGYKLNDNNLLSANLFNVKIENPIVYSVVNLVENYFNFTQAGSKGAEFEYKYNSSKFKMTLNYAMYSSKGLNEVDDYTVPGEDNIVLGLPNNIINGFAQINVNDNISINPSFNFMGKKYGVTSVDNNYDYIIEAYDAQFLANLFVNYNAGGFNAGLGIYDMLDQGQLFLQPYAGGHRGIRGTGREFNVKLSYNLGF